MEVTQFLFKNYEIIVTKNIYKGNFVLLASSVKSSMDSSKRFEKCVACCIERTESWKKTWVLVHPWTMLETSRGTLAMWASTNLKQNQLLKGTYELSVLTYLSVSCLSERFFSASFSCKRLFTWLRPPSSSWCSIWALELDPNWNLDVIDEGQIYDRATLRALSQITSSQGGVSGNRDAGCWAIIISGQWTGHDYFELVDYACQNHNGAHALRNSFLSGEPVRVFRTSACTGPHLKKKSRTGKGYRYDGVYKVMATEEIEWPPGPHHFGKVDKPLFSFRLERLPVGTTGTELNRKSSEDVIQQSIDFLEKSESTSAADAELPHLLVLLEQVNSERSSI